MVIIRVASMHVELEGRGMKGRLHGIGSIIAGGIALLTLSVVTATGQISGPVIEPVWDTIICPPIQIGEEEILPFDSVITNSGDSELIISSMEIVLGDPTEFFVSPAMSFPITVDPGETVGVTIHFQPDANGSRTAILRIESNATNAPTLELVVAGTGATRAIEGRSIDFGQVPPGETRDTVVRGLVWNSGPIPIVIDEITIQSQAFSFPDPDPLPISLDLGDSFDLRIRYAPVITGQTYIDSIRIESDAVPSPLWIRVAANDTNTNSVIRESRSIGTLRLLGMPSSRGVAGVLELDRAADLTLRILDSRGTEVFRQSLGHRPAGSHRIDWSGENHPSGLYHLHLTTDHQTHATPFILLR